MVPFCTEIFQGQLMVAIQINYISIVIISLTCFDSVLGILFAYLVLSTNLMIRTYIGLLESHLMDSVMLQLVGFAMIASIVASISRSYSEDGDK